MYLNQPRSLFLSTRCLARVNTTFRGIFLANNDIFSHAQQCVFNEYQKVCIRNIPVVKAFSHKKSENINCLLKRYRFNTIIKNTLFIMISIMCLRGFCKNITFYFWKYVLAVNLGINYCFSFNSKHPFTFHFGVFETENFVKFSNFEISRK